MALPRADLSFKIVVKTDENVKLTDALSNKGRFAKQAGELFGKGNRGSGAFIEAKDTSKQALLALENELKKKLSKMEGFTEKGLLNILKDIEAVSVENTPLDTGELRASSFAVAETLKTRVRGMVGYNIQSGALIGGASNSVDVDYAVEVHEINKNYNVGSWKFLQRALDQFQNEIPALLVNEMLKALK